VTVHGCGCPLDLYLVLGSDDDQMKGQDRKGFGIRYNPDHDRVLVPASLFCLGAGGEILNFR